MRRRRQWKKKIQEKKRGGGIKQNILLSYKTFKDKFNLSKKEIERLGEIYREILYDSKKHISKYIFFKNLNTLIKKHGIYKIRKDLNSKKRGGFIFTAIFLAIAGAISAGVSAVATTAVAVGTAVVGAATAAAAIPGVALVASSVVSGAISTGTGLAIDAIVKS